VIRWWQFVRRSRCPHSLVRGIYGDEIIFGTPNWNRIQCLDCGKFLDGPVGIALVRAGEPEAVTRWRAARGHLSAVISRGSST
jgi:hypothetical protein